MLFRRFDDVLTDNKELKERLEHMDRYVDCLESSIDSLQRQQSQLWAEVDEQRVRIATLEARRGRRTNPLRRPKGRGHRAVAVMTAQGTRVVRENDELESEKDEGTRVPSVDHELPDYVSDN
jgi:cell division septum initiation protein DivIVA